MTPYRSFLITLLIASSTFITMLVAQEKKNLLTGRTDSRREGVCPLCATHPGILPMVRQPTDGHTERLGMGVSQPCRKMQEKAVAHLLQSHCRARPGETEGIPYLLPK